MGTISASSYDGNIVVGQIFIEGEHLYPFRWELDAEFELLESHGATARADDISADGSVIVGMSDIAGAVRWDEQGMTSLGIIYPQATMISDDASHIVIRGGRVEGKDLAGGSFIQNQFDQSIIQLQFTDDPSVLLYARGVNRDGSLVVGDYPVSESNRRGFVWTPDRGGQDLQSLLVDDFGIDFRGWHLRTARDISADGRFIVGSGDGPNGENIGWLVRLNRPVVVTTGVEGDFDGNAELNAGDADLIANELQSDRNVPLFDLNDDAIVDFRDRDRWVHEIAISYYGDANLDGEFNSTDLVTIFTFGRYETGQVAGWESGDWDSDGLFGSGDLVLAFQDGGFEQGPRHGALPVPEPSADLCSISALLLAALFGNRWLTASPKLRAVAILSRGL
ncbi:MAG: hypothetical protein R3C28_32190 [Pirellulaceae bacterium]